MKPLKQAPAPRTAKEQPAFIARTQRQTLLRMMPTAKLLSDHCSHHSVGIETNKLNQTLSQITQHFFNLPLALFERRQSRRFETVIDPILSIFVR